MGSKTIRGAERLGTSNRTLSSSTTFNTQPTAAKTLLDDDESEESTDFDQSNGVSLNTQGDLAANPVFRVNEEWARRYEHNKKREELHRLEEKFGKVSAPSKRKRGSDKSEDEASVSDASSSNSEDEDDEGLLATEALDAEISATLQAIRARDPRVYDESVTFYSQIDADNGDTGPSKDKERPMYLRDYHRKNLLEGITDETEENGDVALPMTYVYSQDNLKKTIVKEIHAAAAGNPDAMAENDSDGDEEGEDGGFLIPKTSPGQATDNEERPPERRTIASLDVDSAHQDPEQYLSSFMSARAWVPTASSRFQPFESDDEEEDRRAEAFEEAYNFRFEDSARANEKLLSHARDAAAKYSVRREEPNSRKKVRDLERARKEARNKEREAEMARLRKLKIEEVAEKVRKIKEAAGFRGETIREDDWRTLIETDWDDDRWEREMNERFGTSYYAEEDVEHGDEGEMDEAKKRTKIKKPKWDEDIDIKDLVPDFQDEEENEKPPFTLSDEEFDSKPHDDSGASSVENDQRRAKTKLEKARRVQERLDRRKDAKKERKRIEELVDETVNFADAVPPARSKHASQFRYRETSPLTYGLTARDILMASDSQLNQFAGLKKMAAFRDAEKKRKDKKRLGKKARLRQWRKETFGSEEGPRSNFADLLTSQASREQRPTGAHVDGDGMAELPAGRKGRRRFKRHKSTTEKA